MLLGGILGHLYQKGLFYAVYLQNSPYYPSQIPSYQSSKTPPNEALGS